MAFKDDYMDEDMAYFMGLLIARGTIQEDPYRRLSIQFPYSDLEATGITTSFDQQTSIQLGLTNIRERLTDLLATDVQTVSHEASVELVATFVRRSMAWRNIVLLTKEQTSFHDFQVPTVFLDADTPLEWKQHFIRGYGDAAGNVRKSNN